MPTKPNKPLTLEDEMSTDKLQQARDALKKEPK